MTDLCLVMGVVDVGIVLCPVSLGAYSEMQLSIHQERGALFPLVQFVVFPQVVQEESLQHILLLHFDGIDAVHQAGVVHHDACRLLGKLVTLGIDHVDESCIGQILDVVHDGGTRRLYVMSQLADIGRNGAINGQQVEEFLDFGEVFQFNLLQ